MQEPPPGVLLRQPLQLRGDELLAIGADAPRSLIRVHAKSSSEERPDGSLLLQGKGVLAGHRSRLVPREVLPLGTCLTLRRLAWPRHEVIDLGLSGSDRSCRGLLLQTRRPNHQGGEELAL